MILIYRKRLVTTSLFKEHVGNKCILMRFTCYQLEVLYITLPCVLLIIYNFKNACKCTYEELIRKMSYIHICETEEIGIKFPALIKKNICKLLLVFAYMYLQ